MNRSDVLGQLRSVRAAGQTLIGAGAGTGLSAKCSEAGGADLLIVYNSGRYRMAGRGSSAGLMPYGDANAIVMEMAGEVLPVVRSVPVLAGVCGTDPFRLMPHFLRQVKDIGFAGVQNFPTVGIIDGNFRQTLEDTGMSYQLEVDMIRAARELDLLTAAYVFDLEQTQAMVDAGADIVVPHMGTTTSGMIGAKQAMGIEKAIEEVGKLCLWAKKHRPEVLVLAHGGPIATPGDVAHVLGQLPDLDGFFGASSVERLPTETAIVETLRQFKAAGSGDLRPGPTPACQDNNGD
jgi:predicted TIM-barrel enzyme